MSAVYGALGNPGGEIQFFDLQGNIVGAISRPDNLGLILTAVTSGAYSATPNDSVTIYPGQVTLESGNTIVALSNALASIVVPSGSIFLNTPNNVNISATVVDLNAGFTGLNMYTGDTNAAAANMYSDPSTGHVYRSTSSKRYKTKIRRASWESRRWCAQQAPRRDIQGQE